VVIVGLGLPKQALLGASAVPLTLLLATAARGTFLIVTKLPQTLVKTQH